MARVRRMLGVAVVTAAMVAVVAPATGATPTDGPPAGPPYRASVVTTAYGIPHVTAPDVGSLGYGQGWAAARDNVCIIAENAVTTDGERTRWFGPSQSNVVSDVIAGWTLASGRVDELLALTPDDRPRGPSADARALVEGFASGFNRWLADVGGADGITDPACAGAAWVRPITADDLWRRAYESAGRASIEPFASGIVAADPPAAGAASAPAVDARSLGRAASELADTADAGSNAYGLGAASTVSGNGLVLGNPHFPWDGSLRFWQSHLTIPGELDVMGGALVGTPGVQIGFNRDLAWSHTVSTSTRFALRLLSLVPGDPTSYVVDGEVLEMEPVEVAVPGGPTATVWETIYGPVVVAPPLGLGWTTETAVALQDANGDNLRTLDQWNAMGRATSVAELVEAQEEWLGVPWVNTVGADRHGDAVFSHLTVTTGVPDALAQQCIPAPLRPLWQGSGIPVLLGQTRACDPVADPDAPTDGVLGPDDLPVLVNDTYVTNSNDSHWLTNPDQPLEGYARVLGAERTERSLRTRLGLVQVEERLAGTDGLGGAGFTRENLRDVIFGNRVLGAELVGDDLVALCRGDVDLVASGACDALDGWDRRVDVDSAGAVLFREFVESGGLRYADGFDVDAPVTTPRELATDDGRVLDALRAAVARLTAAGIPLDVELGDVQTELRDGEALPMHGGRSRAGVFNVLNAGFQGAAGYPDVVSGASLVMSVELTERGPAGSWLLSYSQSADPTSPHAGDQTRLYSQERWNPIVFERGDVERNAIDRVRLVGR